MEHIDIGLKSADFDPKKGIDKYMDENMTYCRDLDS